MKKILILLPILFLVACNQKKDNKANIQRTTIGGNVGGLNTCMNGQSGVGTIFDAGQAGAAGTFEARVKALLSASVNPAEVGTISSAANDVTGVRFKGIIKLDAAGNVQAAASNITIEVYDSITLSGQEPIRLEFSTSSGAQITGQFNTQTGDGTVTFSDGYGNIQFAGRIDAQNFSGTVRFQNTQNITGAANASGTLGQFTVARCGIIQ